MSKQADRSETATVEINGGLYSMSRDRPGEDWFGVLAGEDFETGERWAMPFWLPESAVAAMEAE